MNLIVPMAGHGARFREAGYQEEKPLIRVNGRTLLEWSLSCVPGWNVFPVVRDKQRDLIEHLRSLFPSSSPTIIPGSTPGAALTVLAAAIGLPQDEPVAVMNCDQWFTLPESWNSLMGKAVAWDGFILTFPGAGPAWSYAVVNGNQRVLHVIEKQEVSRHATVGFYWWRRAGDLVRSVCAMVAAGQTTKGEFYLAPSFNALPLDRCHVAAVPVAEFVGLGTPEQVKAFEQAGAVREP